MGGALITPLTSLGTTSIGAIVGTAQQHRSEYKEYLSVCVDLARETVKTTPQGSIQSCYEGAGEPRLRGRQYSRWEWSLDAEDDLGNADAIASQSAVARVLGLLSDSAV